MRPLLAGCLALLILGVVQAFMVFQASVAPPHVVHAATRAEGKISLEITLTFDAASDGFTPDSLLVLLGGREVLRNSEPIAAGKPVVITNVADLVAGKNEFYLEANTGGEAAEVAKAIRVRVLRDGTPLAEQSLWSEPGEPVAGTVIVDVPQLAQEPVHEH